MGFSLHGSRVVFPMLLVHWLNVRSFYFHLAVALGVTFLWLVGNSGRSLCFLRTFCSINGTTPNYSVSTACFFCFFVFFCFSFTLCISGAWLWKYTWIFYELLSSIGRFLVIGRVGFRISIFLTLLYNYFYSTTFEK